MGGSQVVGVWFFVIVVFLRVGTGYPTTRAPRPFLTPTPIDPLSPASISFSLITQILGRTASRALGRQVGDDGVEESSGVTGSRSRPQSP